MSGIRVHHLNCAHLRRMSLGAPRELTTATGRDRVVPWMACRSTP
jgi:hypothetical protein